MGTVVGTGPDPAFIPARIGSSAEFTQTLMKLQRATHLIASTLDFDVLVDRVVNDIASSIGCVEVNVWLRDDQEDEMVLQGGQGCSKFSKGNRLKIGKEGMVGHVAASGRMRYAPDVALDPYYIACEPGTRSSVTFPMRRGELVMGVLSIDHQDRDAFSADQLKVLEAIAGHFAIADRECPGSATGTRTARTIREGISRCPRHSGGTVSQTSAANSGLCD